MGLIAPSSVIKGVIRFFVCFFIFFLLFLIFLLLLIHLSVEIVKFMIRGLMVVLIVIVLWGRLLMIGIRTILTRISLVILGGRWAQRGIIFSFWLLVPQNRPGMGNFLELFCIVFVQIRMVLFSQSVIAFLYILDGSITRDP